MITKPLNVFKQVKHYDYFLAYYLKSRLGRKKPILGGLKITNGCNLKCTHCPFWHEEGESLPFKGIVSSMKTLYKWGVRILIIEGGEPFLWQDGRRDLRDVVNEAKKRFFSVGVTTNGTFQIDIKSDIVWVSIDGLKETHDHIRGESFDRIIANIEASTHPRIYAHVTINALNWRELSELMTFLAPKVKGITIQFHYPYDSLPEDDELFLAPDSRQEVLDNLIDLKKQGVPVDASHTCLEALKENEWECHPWMMAGVYPDGSMMQGCHVDDHSSLSCEHCGFAAHAEISLAYTGVIDSILVGKKIFERTEH